MQSDDTVKVEPNVNTVLQSYTLKIRVYKCSDKSEYFDSNSKILNVGCLSTFMTHDSTLGGVSLGA